MAGATPGGDDRVDGPLVTGIDRTLFRALLAEEWRMHADLFGARRFAAFPVFVALVTAAGVYFLDVAGVDLAAAVAGVHALVFLFGLQTGTVGFVGRDAMANLLGDVTLLVFTSRTLPISRGRILGLFVLKDLVYYAVLFVAPLTVAFLPTALSGALAVSRLLLLWVALAATFALGLAVTLLLVALSTRGRPGRVAMVGLAVALGLAWATGADPTAATPYALFATPSVASAVSSLVPIPVLAAVGARLYDPERERPARTAESAFADWRTRIGDRDGLVTRSLLDVHRSSGGVFKVVLSATILFAVSAFLVELLAPLVGTDPSTGVTFGALLGLSAFTTYNWLTQFDDPAEYRRLPVGLDALFAAKRRAFLLLSVPVGVLFLGVAVAWLGARPLEVLVGLLLLVGLQVYLFGLVTYLTGFSPNEFLFDTLLFALFGLAVAAALVPLLVVGLVVTPVPPVLLAGLGIAAVVAAGVGEGLYRRAVPRWSRRYASGEL